MTSKKIKYTLGPWEHGSLWYPEDGRPGKCDISQVGSLGIHMQVILPAKGREAYDEGVANVSFAVALPDLFVACEAALQQWAKCRCGHVFCTDCKVRNVLEAATTFARGES